jgi:integrase
MTPKPARSAAALGALLVPDITEAHVRRWRKNLLDSGVGPVTTAKAYRLLKVIFNTAVDDGLIRRNPCRIRGAGQENSPERPVLTMGQVFVLADAFADRRYRLLVLLAVFCSLRWGELAALRRKHIDSTAGLVRVEVAVVELTNGALVTGPPKSASGIRWVSIPTFLLSDVIEHLEQFTDTAENCLVFAGPKGAQLRRSNFTRQWNKALQVAGMTGIHFHDLRHTGNTLAEIGGVASDATFPGRRERAWPALRRWNPRGEETWAGSKVADDLRWHYPVASAHTMMRPDLLHPAAA